MALVFPSSASIGQTYQSGSSPIYTYNGSVWTLSQGNVGIAALNSFSASLQHALQITGSNATMLGNLSVQGTQTALNQASLQITDKTIRIASGSTTSAQANGAGILIDGANVTMSWDSVNSLFKFGTQISASKYYGDGSGLTGVSSYTNSDNLSYINSKGIISGSSQLTSSYDSRYVLSGSITQTTWNNIASKPSGIVSGSSQVLGGSGVISGSSQLTSSFDGRYVLESETGSLQTSITNLNTFTASQSTASLVTSITNLNTFTASFSTSVNSRVTTLESSIITGSANYIQVLGNRRTSITTTGVSIISGSITTNGNPVQIMVTGDANPTTTSYTRLQIYRNETAIGNMVQVENSSNLNVPYCINVIDTASAGTYTYSMRTVSIFAGSFDFGENAGPTLTAVELNSNTTIRSTNNTFTGTNTFTNTTNLNGPVTIGASSGDEGGEIQLAKAQTNTTLTGSAITIDSYRDRIRIFEQGGNARGVHIDLSKTPTGVAGELIWKVSGFVNAGTFVTLDNIKATITTSGNRGLSIAAVSTTFTANISATYGFSAGGSGAASPNFSITTTPTTSLFNWGFSTEGDGSTYIVNDKTNSRVYRIIKMIGNGFNNNFISIERLY